MNKTVLITGVSPGIGREAALLLASDCLLVFRTVRKETPGLNGVELVKLDVTDGAAQAASSAPAAAQNGLARR